MEVPVREHINHIKEDNHTKVYFRFSGYGDYAVMQIEEFLKVFSDYKIDLNGEFIKPDGEKLHSCYIRRTG